jgi:hypothetical protein
MSRRKENILYIMILMFVLTLIIVYSKYRREQDNSLAEKGNKTIGLIVKRNLPGARTISSVSYNYIFYVNSVQFTGGSLCDKKYTEGSFFEVTYLKENPEKSRMEFTKPVKKDSVCIYFEGDCPFEKDINSD